MGEKTKISDVLVPEVFLPYVINRTAEKSAFWQSGIVGTPDVAIGANLTAGGHTVNMPFWNDLVGDDEVLSDTTSLSVNKITAGKDVAVVHFRGRAWSVNDLAGQLSGSDPLAAIAGLVGDWWARVMQKTMLSELKGVFEADSMECNVRDIHEDSSDDEPHKISAASFIDASQVLGDARDSITAVAMHSAVETSLLKKDLIETIRDSEGRFVMKTFLGRRVIVDDGLPFSSETGVATTYLFGQGAFGYAEGGTLAPLEYDRDILAGDTVFTNRRAFVLHPRGVKWKGTAEGASPTKEELETGTNWERVYEPKQVRIVQFIHNV